MPSKIIIADDHPLVRSALRQVVSGALGSVEILESGDFEQVRKLLAQESDIDLILLDLNMPGVHGLAGLMYVRAEYSAVPVAIVSATTNPLIMRRCIDFGAVGFIPKTENIAAMRPALQTIFAGQTWTPEDVDLTTPLDDETADLLKRLDSLTPQQWRVLTMVSEGKLNKQIAYELNVSEATVKAHVSAILQKLDVESRTQAVIVTARLNSLVI